MRRVTAEAGSLRRPRQTPSRRGARERAFQRDAIRAAPPRLAAREAQEGQRVRC